jgi:hypothetical protein
MTKMGVSRSLAAGLAVFFTVAILFSSRTVLAADKPLQLENRESQAVTIALDLEKLAWVHGATTETQDKDYPHVIE